MAKFTAQLCLLIILLATPVISSAQPVSLGEKTIGAFYFNARALYENYVAQLDELAKPENQAQLDSINALATKYLNKTEFNLRTQIDEFASFEEKKLFMPLGSLWFSIDDNYRPQMVLPAECKPIELYDFFFAVLGEPSQLKSAKRDKELVEIEFPTPQFNVIFRIASNAITLSTDAELKPVKVEGYWKELVSRSGKPETLLDLQINFNVVKRLVALRVQSGRHSVCLGNLMAIKSAVEMYQIENGEVMKELDLAMLAEKHYIPYCYSCSEGGKYELDNKNGIEISCSVHGTIEKPVSAKVAKKVDIDPRLEPFETFRLEIDKNQILAKMQIKDKNLLSQYEAISKHQILTIRHMATNQIGHLPEEQKQKAVQMSDSIKCWSENGWLCFSVSGINEKTLASGLIGAVEVLRTMALPRFKKAREIEMRRQNPGRIMMQE